MRVTIYRCDTCKKEIGDKIHLSFSFGNYSGVAVPEESYPGKIQWTVKQSLAGMFLHFCSSKHLAEYFEDLIVKSSKKKGKV